MRATATIPWSAPAFMAPVVERVRRESGLPVAIAWGVGPPEIADSAVRNGQADLGQGRAGAAGQSALALHRRGGSGRRALFLGHSSRALCFLARTV
jgi:hypothetical protein